MNCVVLSGRLVRDPEIRYSQNESQMCIARFTIAVNRRFRREGEPTADFITCQAFGKTGEFVEKYFKKGMKADISGRWQTGSYTNKDGDKVYTNTCIVDNAEFGESKAASQQNTQNDAPASQPQQADQPAPTQDTDFMDLPDDDLGELPFR